MVQGVGFRPHLYRLAQKHGLRGEVANSPAGVELILEGGGDKICLFLDQLQQSPPSGSLITALTEEDLPAINYSQFSIGPSHNTGSRTALAPADFGMCQDCQEELEDPADRRFQHPFISCTACGPRYTLVNSLPYDRPLTSMADFPLCSACQKEYNDPASRRFHAEPICCHDCGPRLTLFEDGGENKANPLASAAALLSDGKVVAIKGVGGFHLAADACNDQAVGRLRTIKRRVDKPLAIMVRDLDTAAALAHISAKAQEALCSAIRPIVIMPIKAGVPFSKLITRNIPEIGIMLAYTPLHYLLFNQAPQILVMTSFNEPGSPMLTGTKEALALLGTDCDGVLSHDRHIITRCDDSVLRSHGDEILILRRSRGYTPLPIALDQSYPAILACGAGEKVTLCLTRDKMAFLSQHLGETRSPISQDHYRQACSHLQNLFHISPEIIAHDLHPDYFSSRYALEQTGIEKIAVQHHHGHIASCMTEHGLDQPVIGVALDGTGLGADGTLWGGEILLSTLADFKRLAHFDTLEMAGGETAIKEPWRLALAWLHKEDLQGSELAFLTNIPPATKNIVEEMLAQKVNCPTTSSLGRLFDAVAALINLRLEITHSAQAAMELEAIADPDETGVYPFNLNQKQDKECRIIETKELLQGILADLKQETPQAAIATRFHNTIIKMISQACLDLSKEHNINEVVCSGGVFQNRLISQGLKQSLEEVGLMVYCHQQVPCNDGGLALGQAAVAAARIRNLSSSKTGVSHA